MENETVERPALLIIDMVKDYFDEDKPLPITSHAREIIGPINGLIRVFRNKGWPVVFSTDAFRRQDFIFKGRMNPHSLAGTTGAEVIEELERKEEDLWLPKRRFSAFFGTGLDQWLRQRQVTLCAVSGITTNVCVLSTVLDAICCDFKAVFLEDLTGASSREIHEQTLNLYRRNPIYPLLRVLTSQQLKVELGVEG